MTNASPIVAAPGGKTRVIGTNPMAFSVPDGAGGIAMQFDQSTTTVALGKITMARLPVNRSRSAGRLMPMAIPPPIRKPRWPVRWSAWAATRGGALA